MDNRRLDKYDTSNKPTRSSRVDKHETLYDELNSKIGYSEAVDLTSNATLDLNSFAANKKSRENYQQVKEVQDLIAPTEPISKEVKKEEIQTPKSFDINEILEEAKKNRGDIDDLEHKRNLKDSDYSVLTNLNRKYLHKKDVTKEDVEELQELIDTITQSSITTETTDDGKELLADLMTASVKTDFDDDEKTTKDEEEVEEELSATVAPNTFYTKSMEITEDDFDVREEIQSEIKKSNKLIIVLVILILMVLTAIISYFILRHLEISLF